MDLLRWQYELDQEKNHKLQIPELKPRMFMQSQHAGHRGLNLGSISPLL